MQVASDVSAGALDQDPFLNIPGFAHVQTQPPSNVSVQVIPRQFHSNKLLAGEVPIRQYYVSETRFENYEGEYRPELPDWGKLIGREVWL
jgi:hypothetical protein